MDAPEVNTLLEQIDPQVGLILRRALGGEEVSWQDGLRLCETNGLALHSTLIAADELRRRQAGEVVSYVVNRNINFTNVCIKHCSFCAFSREHRAEQAYFLPTEEIIRRAQEAVDMGATEICMQAGLPPKMDGRLYIDLTRSVKRALPDLHIHAFSPEEIAYGALREGVPVVQYLKELKDAGLGTLPGTSAEILDQEIRDAIAPGRITVRQWVEVITSAHSLGIPTTSTIMFGHIETPLHWVKHLNLLRDIQKETHGFTEFVPLSFVYQEAPLYLRGLVHGVRRGATGTEVVKLHALARIMLGATFRNIQASWVKEGPKMAQHLLTLGANDLGGTLMNESISTAAGAQYGQLVAPRELRRWILDLNRIPAQRSTTYRLLKVFHGEDEEDSPLDQVEDANVRFGSYGALTAAKHFRYVHPFHRTRARATSSD
ncbi:MAG TPA: 5-amino-6-(D-ribitylamino)uracil--L-tyrosine 4-hydroxyphenyl transferase CofH [Acidobacteriota bacterium]|nr:5-amino-6-(D-ribitylamino)uracil--L-tyrosine 4-hydroxyphenyl transferase CofH [Acidobacteriota bacterium]